MTTIAESVSGTGYSWGGDDHAFVELAEEISLQFSLQSFLEDPDGYNATLLGVLRAD